MEQDFYGAVPSWEADPFRLGQVREKYRVPLEEGERIAEIVRQDLEPLSEALILVGSIRRRRPTIADVEFVVLPKDPEAFHKAVEAMGFRAGEERRKYSGILEGIKVELYIARKPEELGAMTLWYTGDWKFNMITNARAKRMGLIKNQYGIWKPGPQGRLIPVLQDPDERAFFDFLGMEWREPEQRSMAARADLEKMVRALRAAAGRLEDADIRFVEEAGKKLKRDKWLPPEEEARLRDLHVRFGKPARTAVSGFVLGAEELIELGQPIQERIRRPEPCPGFWGFWQNAYDRAVGKGGYVGDVFAEIGRMGGLAIAVEVDEPEGRVFYTPYLDPVPDAEDLLEVESDPDLWLCRMSEAVDWGTWNWGPSMRGLPEF
jgi:hypothetical protein